MAVGDLIDGDWQVEWRGVRFGGDGPIGVTEIVGLGDLPDVTSADRDRLRAHGQISGDDFMGGRSIELGLNVTKGDYAAVEALANTAVPGSAESALVVQVPGVAGGRKVRANVRMRAKSIPMTPTEFGAGLVDPRLLFHATDPRLYDAVDTVQAVSLPSGGGGLSVPVEVPAVLTAQVESGAMFVPNDGNFSAPWSARIDGPCVNPIVRNVTEGLFLGFNITLADGEWLELDTAGARTVMLNGVASRYYTITPGSTWWDHSPGTTELAFRASTTTAAQLTVTSRSAWTS